jgi:hypothetical protein
VARFAALRLALCVHHLGYYRKLRGAAVLTDDQVTTGKHTTVGSPASLQQVPWSMFNMVEAHAEMPNMFPLLAVVTTPKAPYRLWHTAPGL